MVVIRTSMPDKEEEAVSEDASKGMMWAPAAASLVLVSLSFDSWKELSSVR
jgi:hypothetical protein